MKQRQGVYWIALAAILLAGIFLRIAFIRSSAFQLDADTSIVYLMSVHASEGDLSIFFWGQGYGGTLLQLISGAVIHVAGPTPVAVAAVEVGLGCVVALLLAHIVRAELSSWAALAAVCLYWFPGTVMLSRSVIDPGFYVTSLGLALAAVALARGGSARRPIVRAVAVGVLGGLAFWQSPAGGALAALAVLPLIAGRDHKLRSLFAAAAGAAIGALPWIVGLAIYRSDSVKTFSSPLEHLPSRIAAMISTMLPAAFDAHSAPVVAIAIGVALVVLVATASALSIRSRKWGLSAVILGVPAVMVVLVAAGSQLGFDERRYVALMLAGLAASVVTIVARWRVALVTVAALAAILTTTLVGTRTDGFAERAERSPFGSDITELHRYLDAKGIENVWASYWEAYRLSAETNEEITAASFPFVRYSSYNERVSSQPTTIIVVRLGETNDQFLQSSDAPTSSSRTVVGSLVVYSYATPIDVPALPLGVF